MPNRSAANDTGPPGASEHWIEVEGMRVRFLQAGRGPAVVLLHGLLGYAFNFRRVIPRLAESRTLFAPDLPGAGYSECRSDLDCRLRSSALRLARFLDAVGVEKADFIASSYGGATALMLASMAPARIRRLVLVAPANPWSKIGGKRLALLRNSAIAYLFPPLARAARPLHSLLVRRMWGDGRRASAESLAGYVKPLTRPGVFEHALGMVRTWRADMQELRAALQSLRELPVLLVWGSCDRLVDPLSARPLAACFSDARVEVIAGAGHLPYEETPEEFCRIVEPFLADRNRVPSRPADAGSNLTTTVAGARLKQEFGPNEFLG